MVDREDGATEATLQTATVSRRNMIIGGALLALGGAAFARAPVRRAPSLTEEAFEATVPTTMGKWTSYDSSALILPPEDDLSRKLYEHILTRIYYDGAGNEVMFLVAYSSIQIGDVQVHRPEVCYKVAGFDILRNRPADIRFDGSPLVKARKVVTESRLRRENILYWTRVGREFPLNWSGQRIAMMEANLGGYYPDGALVRMSSVKHDMQDAMPDFESFGRALWENVPPAGRALLFGV